MEGEKERIRACPHCGSNRIVPTMLFGGPMAQLDHYDGKYHCLDCGKEAVPLDFRTDADSEEFRASKDTVPEPSTTESFLRVPIVPLNTAPLFTMGPLEIPVGKVARVVNINWTGSEFETRDFSVPFLDYWNAVSGKRYNAHELFLMDLSGICRGRPNFTALKKLIKHRYETWLDLGITDLQDLFDSFALDISWAVAGTLSCPSIKLLEEIYELSDSCVPCVYLDSEVRWGKEGAGPSELSRLLRDLASIGFERIAVIDLNRLGKREGHSEGLALRLEGSDSEILMGGGVRESDFEALKEIGFRGALVDPFTPVIESIIEVDGEEEPTDHTMSTTTRTRSESPNALPMN